MPLAPISDPDLVVPTITRALELKETDDPGPGWSRRDESQPLQFLQANLHGKQLLLLLDNFEQVASAAPLLVTLLEACPALKMLVTSRAVLHVRGEHEFAVPPLALPDLNHLPDIESLTRYAAVQLFMQRALAIRPAFPDVHLTIEDMIAEGDRVVTRYTARATQTGEFFGIPPSGKQVTVTGISISRIADGRIVEQWGNQDDFGMMQQLGVIPAMG